MIDIYVIRSIAVLLLGILGISASHFVNEFGNRKSGVFKWLVLFLAFLSTSMIVVVNPLTTLNQIDTYTFQILTVTSITVAVDLYFILRVNLFNLVFSRRSWVVFFGLFIAWNCIPFSKFCEILPPKFEVEKYQVVNFNPLSNESLLSSQRSDYIRLRDLLSEGKFKAADAEVRRAMNIDEIPLAKQSCQDFKIVDNLWRFYSDGKFGFKVQSEIRRQSRIGFFKQIHSMLLTLATYGDLSSKAQNFYLELLGWKVNGHAIDYDKLTFSLAAPLGHLPYSVASSGDGDGLMEDNKVSECKM